MAGQVLHARTIFQDGQQGQDNASVNFVFQSSGAASTIATSDLDLVVQGFFNSLAPGQGNSVASYISPAVSRATNASVTNYTDVTNHLDGLPAGPPFSQTSWTLAAPAPVGGFPSQVAIACGYRAAYGALTEHGGQAQIPSDDDAIDQGAPPTHLGRTRPRANVRGRFYIGPLSQVAMTTDGTEKLTTTAITDLTKALSGLATTTNPGGTRQFNMVVWSRRTAIVTPVNPGGFVYISEGFATQRRRIDTTEVRRHNWVPTGTQ